jgi:hypothetical protein
MDEKETDRRLEAALAEAAQVIDGHIQDHLRRYGAKLMADLEEGRRAAEAAGDPCDYDDPIETGPPRYDSDHGPWVRVTPQ